MKFKDHENFKRIILRLKSKVGIIIIFLALSPKWPFEISKIAKFAAKFIVKLKRFLLSFKNFKKIFAKSSELMFLASKLCAMIGRSPEDSDLFE